MGYSRWNFSVCNTKRFFFFTLSLPGEREKSETHGEGSRRAERGRGEQRNTEFECQLRTWLMTTPHNGKTNCYSLRSFASVCFPCRVEHALIHTFEERHILSFRLCRSIDISTLIHMCLLCEEKYNEATAESRKTWCPYMWLPLIDHPTMSLTQYYSTWFAWEKNIEKKNTQYTWYSCEILQKVCVLLQFYISSLPPLKL